MSLDDFVLLNISVSGGNTPTVQGFKTGLCACFHTHYPDLLRVYETADALTQMALDGFRTDEAGYKAVAKYAAAPNAPSLVAVGRRQLPPLQRLTLTLTDGTPGHPYDFTLVGSDGASYPVHYVNALAPGAALAGTVQLLSGSTAVTFGTPQTLAAGALLMFGGVGGQPGTYYALSAAITAATAAVLTTPYGGTGSATATMTASSLAPLAGTVDVVNGSVAVVPTVSPVGVVQPGDALQFASQMGTYYTVLTVVAGTITLTTPYSGNPGTGIQAWDVSTSASAATAIAAIVNAFGVSPAKPVGVATAAGSVITLARSDGQLTDVQDWVSNGFGNIQLANTTADPGITADLDAIQSANNAAFYGVFLDSNSAAEVEAAAVWAESTGVGGKFLFADCSDSVSGVANTTLDLFPVLHADSLKRSHVGQNNTQLLSYAGAGLCGQLLAMNPGSYTAAYKSLPEVPADSETTLPTGQAHVINSQSASLPGPGGKWGNYYKTQAGQNWTFPGCTPSGQYVDLTIGIDWLKTNMQADVAAVIASLPKLPMTDNGAGLIRNAIDTRLRLASTPAYGLILPDGQDPLRPISVTVPSIASVDSTDRANRNLPNVAWSAGLAGAILTATIGGTLIP
jgi:Protein of unknown function (DUF3383)